MSILTKNEPLNAEILYLSGQQPVRNQWRENYLKMYDFMWPWKLEKCIAGTTNESIKSMSNSNEWEIWIYVFNKK